jgi:hypothetical protein
MPAKSVPTISGAEDKVAEALHHGRRMLLLGVFCAPPVFLPLAIRQGIAANKARSGAGMSLLLAAGGVSVFWLGAAGIAEYISH